MKNSKFFLTTLFAAAAMTATAHATGEIISINFGNAGNAITESMTGTAGLATYDNGTAVGAAGWANVSGNEQQTVDLKNYDGTLISGASVTARSDFATWGPYGSDGTVIRSLQGSYYDLANWGIGSWNVEIESTFLVCDVYVYLSGDGGQYGAVSVNGTFYKGDATNGSVEGSGAWGDRAYSDNLVLGTNALKVSGVSGLLSLTNERSTSNRATLSGIQVVNTYTGSATNVSLDGTAIDWTDTAIGSVGWTDSTSEAGVYAAFGVTADTAVNVTGTSIVTDGIVVSGSGMVTFSGNDLTLIGLSTIRAGGSTSAEFSNNLTFSGNASIGGNVSVGGSVVFENGGSVSGNVAVSGAVSVTGGVLLADSTSLSKFTGAVSIGENGALNLGNLTSAKTDVSSITGTGKIIFNAQPSNHSSGIKLGSGFEGTVEVSGNANLPRDSELGGATKVILNNTYIWSDSTITYSQLFEVVGVATNIGNVGWNKQRGGANITYTNTFTLTENSSFSFEQGTTTFQGDFVGDETTSVHARNTLTFSGDASTGSFYQTGGTVTFSGDATMTQYVGTSGGYGNGTLNVSDGATLTVTGDSNSTEGNQGSFQLAHWGSTQTVNVSGTFNLMNAGISNKDGNGDINVSGEANFNAGLIVADTSNNADVIRVHVNDGGRINIGAGGISDSNVLTLNLNGGSTIGSLTDAWSSSRALALGGNVTFDTQKRVFDGTNKTVSADVGSAVTLSGVISGSGTIEKIGAGTLVLSGANTHGGTVLTAGTLKVGGASALGGELVLAGGTLAKADNVSEVLSFSLGVSVANVVNVQNIGFAGGTWSFTDALDTSFTGVTLAGDVTFANTTIDVFGVDFEADSNQITLFTNYAGTDASVFNAIGGTISIANGNVIFTAADTAYTLYWNPESAGDKVWSASLFNGTDYSAANAFRKFEFADRADGMSEGATISGEVTARRLSFLGDYGFGGTVAGETAAKLTFGTGTDDAGTVTGTAIVSVADGKTAIFDKTVATAGALEKTGAGRLVFAADSASTVASVAITDGVFALTVTDDIATEAIEAATFAGALSGTGTFEKAGTGTLLVSGENTAFSGNVLVSEGTLKLLANSRGTSAALGTTNAGITIGAGATFDFNGVYDTWYGNYVLAGGSLVNNGNNIGDGNRQIADGFSLTADSTIGGTGRFGMISGGYAPNEIDLGGYTLTKTGTNTFVLCDTTLKNGTLDIQSGKVAIVNKYAYIEDNVVIKSAVADGVSFDFNSRNLFVNENASLTLSGNFERLNGIRIYEGGTLDLTQARLASENSNAAWINILGGTLKIADLSVGVGSNFGGNHDSGNLYINADGVLEVTQAQAVGAGAGAGFEVWGGTYRYSGTGTSYVAETTENCRIEVGTGTVLTWDVVNADASLEVSKVIIGDGAVELDSTGTVMFSGANTYTGGTTITRGTLKVGSDDAFGTGTVTISENGVLETGVSETTTIANVLTGAGTVEVKGDTTLTGRNTFAGKYSVSGGAVLSVSGLLGSDSVTVEVAENGELNYTPTTGINSSGFVSLLSENSVLRNSSTEGAMTTLTNTVSGNGKIVQSSGELNLKFAKLGGFTGTLQLEGGVLSDVVLDGTIGVSQAVVSGGTMKNWTVDDAGASLLVNADEVVALSGNIVLTTGMLSLEKARTEAYFTGTANVSIGSDFAFNFLNLDLKDTEDPLTKTATVRMFDLTNLTLTGWDSLTYENILIRGRELDAHYEVEVGNSGDVTITLTSQMITWTAGSTGTWDKDAENWALDNGTAIVFADYDTVRFASDAAVTLNGELTPVEIVVEDNVTLTLSGSGKVLNGTTNLGGGATLELVANSAATPVFNNKVSGAGMFKLDNEVDVSVSETLNGGYSLSGNVAFVKEGAGTLAADVAQEAFTGTTSIDAGKILVSATNALGTGAVTLNGGSLEFSATTGETLSVNNAIGGVTATDASLTISGGGSVVLTQASSYTGTTSVSGNAIAQNAEAFGGSAVAVSGNVTLDAEGEFTNDFSGAGKLLAAKSGTLSGSMSSFVGTLEVGTNVALKLDSTSNFAGTTVLGEASTLEKIGADTFTISGAINGVANSALAVKDGVLAVGNDTAAQSFVGKLTAESGKSFEKVGSNTLTLSGELSGTGMISVMNGTLAVGNDTTAQSFAGSVSVATGKTFKKIGANTLTLSGKLSGAGATTVSEGILNLDVASDYALDSVISGAGTLKKSGEGKVALATGTNVDAIDLAGGTLANAKIGNAGAEKLTVSGAGTTLEALTMNGGTLDLTQNGTTLSGTATLSGGTIKLSALSDGTVGMKVTGTMTVTAGTLFNFADLVYPTVTRPNAAGVDYVEATLGVFDATSGTLEGWNADTLGKANFSVGESMATLSERATLEFNENGSLTIYNQVYTLTWNGDEGIWASGNSSNWTNAAVGFENDTAYMNSDNVIFASDATVSLGSNVAPATLVVNDGVDLEIVKSESSKLTGSGTVSVGVGATLDLNSAHNYTGTTTLESRSTLLLNLSANDSVQFKSPVSVASGAKATLAVNTESLGADSVTSLETVFAGDLALSGLVFEKLGEGTLSVSNKLGAYTTEGRIEVQGGVLQAEGVGAVGMADLRIGEGATLRVAEAEGKSEMLNNRLIGSGLIEKSGAGTLSIDKSNSGFNGDVSVTEGTLILANSEAVGDDRKASTITVGEKGVLELQFSETFAKDFAGVGKIIANSSDPSVFNGESSAFTGTFVVNGGAVRALTATAIGNGTVLLADADRKVHFDVEGNGDVFAGTFSGAGTVVVETDSFTKSLVMTGAASTDFSGTLSVADNSSLKVENAGVLGNVSATTVIGKNAELVLGSATDSALVTKLSGNGDLRKVGSGTIVLSNSGNDLSGSLYIDAGSLSANGVSALGKVSQLTLAAGTSLGINLQNGERSMFDKKLRGDGAINVSGNGIIDWRSQKTFSGALTFSKATINTTDRFAVDSGSVNLTDGAVWNAKGGFSVDSLAVIRLSSGSGAAIATKSAGAGSAGTRLVCGDFSANANTAGTIEFSNISVSPTVDGTLISFGVEMLTDANKARIVLTNDATVTLNNASVEVVLSEEIDNPADLTEIAFVKKDGANVDVSGDISQVTILLADGTTREYLYDGRSGNLTLEPISDEMNLAYAAMVAMPTELFSQDVQSLHRRMEQRRFDTRTNKDLWEFFAQAQSMQVENGNDRADSATFDFSTYGALVGGDVRLGESTLFGLALAYDHGTADIHDSQGEITADDYRMTAYAGTVFGNYFFAEAGAHFGFASYEIERQGDYGNNKGETDGWSAGAFFSTGCLIPTMADGLFLTPYASVAYLHTAVEKFEETGTQSMAADDMEADSLRVRVGVGLSYAFELGEVPTRFGLDVAYSHELLDDELDAKVGADLDADSGDIDYTRTITEKTVAESAVSVGASLDFTLSENTGLYLGYSADIGTNSDVAHRANIGFRFTY